MLNNIEIGDLVHIPMESKVIQEDGGGLRSLSLKKSMIGLVLGINGWEYKILCEENIFYVQADKLYPI
jgi:hypothetical protein